MSPKVLVINPNSSLEMTRMIERSSHSAGTTATIEVLRSPHAPEGINTDADEEAAIVAMLELPVMAHLDEYDAIVVACFGDPGVPELTALTDRPVIGIARAAMSHAASDYGSFGVLAASDEAGPLMTSLVAAYDLDAACRGVVTLGVDVTTLARGGDRYLPLIEQRAEQLVSRNGAASVLLGCTALGSRAAHLSAATGIPVIDPIHAAVRLIDQTITTA